MHRYTGLAVVIVAAALGFILWATSSVVSTNAGVARSSTGLSPHEIMTGSKDLPIHQIQDPM